MSAKMKRIWCGVFFALNNLSKIRRNVTFYSPAITKQASVPSMFDMLTSGGRLVLV